MYFGNRNWEPYVEEAFVQMARDGVEHVYVFATSAWGGYSGCRQYQEDIARGLAAIQEASEAEPGLRAPRVERLPGFHNHPDFIREFAAAVDRAGLAAVKGLGAPEADAGVREQCDLIFTAHSVPTRADEQSGPEAWEGKLYSHQVLDAARLVQSASIFSTQRNEDVNLVWQSRSGSPHTPWLEPDVCDHIRARAAAGNTRPIVLCPIGFITDHIEVMWDLDTEAKNVADEAGIPFTRVPTPGLGSAFATMIVDLAAECDQRRRDSAAIEPVRETAAAQLTQPGLFCPAAGTCVPSLGHTFDGQPCAPGCCGA